jgi:hypothetical protein
MKNNKIKILIILLILLILGLIIVSYFIFFKRNISLNCDSHSIDNCPKGCVICPPCETCSSISCQTKKFCQGIGFNEEWYIKYVVR